MFLIHYGTNDVYVAESKEELKKENFVIKEGCQYKIKIYFHVQREIVSGLKYEHKVYKDSGIVSGKLSKRSCFVLISNL